MHLRPDGKIQILWVIRIFCLFIFLAFWQSCVTQVHLSYIYPNDYTRLTHLDPQDSCFYPEKPSLKRDPAQKNEYYDPRWSQTFDVKYVNFEETRTDGIDLKCEIKGNLLLSSSETLPLVQAFMNKLNEKHPGYELRVLFFLFSLQHLDHNVTEFTHLFSLATPWCLTRLGMTALLTVFFGKISL